MSSCCDKPGLMPLSEAQALLMQGVTVTSKSKLVSLDEALGRVLAEDIQSDLNVPPADNSAMDGYCLRWQDYVEGQSLPISQRIPAGVVAESLQPGTAARIFTGAELPVNADTVVMQEDTREDENGVLILEAPEQGQHIRPVGQDIQQGQSILQAGQIIRPQDMGLLASIGVAKVSVYKPLRVAVLSTGDELVEPGQSIQQGQIYNSNRYTLLGLLQRLGMEAVDLGVVPDDLEATRKALQEAAVCDVIISSGGVSVGEEDYIKTALDELGEVQLWKLAIKPGKPFTYGRVMNTPFLGLPGNPAAVFVTFCILCRPWLLKKQGASQVFPTSFQVRAGFDINKPGKRQEYLRVRLQSQEGESSAELYSNQSSGVLYSASWGDGLVELPIDSLVKKGDWVTFLSYDSVI